MLYYCFVHLRIFISRYTNVLVIIIIIIIIITIIIIIICESSTSRWLISLVLLTCNAYSHSCMTPYIL